MKVLFQSNDVNHMSVTPPPLLATSSMRSIKDCFRLHLQELKNLLYRRGDISCLLIPAQRINIRV
jgi:hypothetical protein